MSLWLWLGFGACGVIVAGSWSVTMETGRLDLLVEVLAPRRARRSPNQDQVTINMSRISRIVVLVTSLAAVVGAIAGTAGAVTWHVSGSGSFTATAPSETLSGTIGPLACTSATATGTYAPGSLAGAVYSGVAGTITFGCTIGLGFEFSCGYRLTATAQPTVTVVTTGNLDMTCAVTFGSGGKLCDVAGSRHAIYTKGASADTLTLTTTTLNVSGSGCQFGTNDALHFSEQTFTVTSAGGGPHIVRTA
ncbi:hypothetical protein [Baekduia sp. Peel2402]|uniref:hypothetical protein n=1 Tax=Baekduia sp. Peel2402 TaxID=3458296 RepID=UPI00403EDEB0